jgi:hypothetical protein
MGTHAAAVIITAARSEYAVLVVVFIPTLPVAIEAMSFAWKSLRGPSGWRLVALRGHAIPLSPRIEYQSA